MLAFTCQPYLPQEKMITNLVLKIYIITILKVGRKHNMK